ncbi:MAG: MerR family transcriptional regulator [Dehalococcoidia bacterium]|jgi:DNA-binding transcriptional MerR regulator
MKIEKPFAIAIKSKTQEKGQLMRISEVARAAGVSTPTVHYYIKQGLLMPPAVTSRNMAYYDPHCVEEIRLIKELQIKKYLPLAVIKMIMQHERTGEQPAHLVEMREALGEMFRPLDKGEKSGGLTFTQLIASSGVPGAVLKKMQAQGLLSPVGSGRDKHYDDIDANIARNIKELMDHGMTTKDLGVFNKYIEVIHEIATTLHDRIHDQHKENSVRPVDLSIALNNLRSLLAVKVHRQVFLELMEHQK